MIIVITWKSVLIVLALFAALNLCRYVFGWGTDDSDKSNWNRSGLRVLTDAKTGVQYLETSDGAITPRIDANGKPIVKGGAE